MQNQRRVTIVGNGPSGLFELGKISKPTDRHTRYNRAHLAPAAEDGTARLSVPQGSFSEYQKEAMTSSTSDDNSVLLVHAYLDGELDPANALEIAQRMSTDPALAAEGQRVKALQRLIHERLHREVAPPDLRARIEASVGGHRRARERPSWRALAASIALTAVVASSSTWFITGSEPANTVADTLVLLRCHGASSIGIRLICTETLMPSIGADDRFGRAQLMLLVLCGALLFLDGPSRRNWQPRASL
jgi:hypothetical protein